MNVLRSHCGFPETLNSRVPGMNPPRFHFPLSFPFDPPTLLRQSLMVSMPFLSSFLFDCPLLEHLQEVGLRAPLSRPSSRCPASRSRWPGPWPGLSGFKALQSKRLLSTVVCHVVYEPLWFLRVVVGMSWHVDFASPCRSVEPALGDIVVDPQHGCTPEARCGNGIATLMQIRTRPWGTWAVW